MEELSFGDFLFLRTEEWASKEATEFYCIINQPHGKGYYYKGRPMEVPTHQTPFLRSVILLLIQSRAKCGLYSRYRRHEMLARMWGSREKLAQNMRKPSAQKRVERTWTCASTQGTLRLRKLFRDATDLRFEATPSWMMTTPTDIVLDFNCNHSETLYGVLRIEPLKAFFCGGS